MHDLTEPIVYQQQGIRITPSAVFVRKRRIPYDQIVRFDAGVRRPNRVAPGFLISSGFGGLGFVALGIMTAEGEIDALPTFACVGLAMVVTLLGSVWYGALNNKFAVVLRLRSGQVDVVAARTEEETRPLREALAHAIATHVSTQPPAVQR